jgi:hypothetical protein
LENKMSKTWGQIENKVAKPTAKYYMYADGSSYWGISLWRNDELPIECGAEQHHNMALDQKIEWYTKKVEEIRINAEEEAKKRKKN